MRAVAGAVVAAELAWWVQKEEVSVNTGAVCLVSPGGTHGGGVSKHRSCGRGSSSRRTRLVVHTEGVSENTGAVAGAVVAAELAWWDTRRGCQ